MGTYQKSLKNLKLWQQYLQIKSTYEAYNLNFYNYFNSMKNNFKILMLREHTKTM